MLETRQPLGSLTWGFKIKDQANSRLELTGGTDADCKDTPSADWGKTLDQFYAGKFETILDEFEIAKADLKPDHKTKLDGVVTKMKADTSLKAQLGGACDLTGDEQFNKALSLKRAENARDYLVAKGIDASRLRPYEPGTGENLIASNDPAVTSRLLAEASGGGDRVYRLAVVHLLGMRATSDVDAALIALLDDRDVGATAAYLLGRAGFKGYPSRTRDVAAIAAALRRHLDDAATFDDPFYRRTFRVQDFVLGALARLIGPERFKIADPRFENDIGYALPWWSDAVRAELLTQVRTR